MQLLIQRGQRKSPILRRPVFDLWAKFELNPEEEALIHRYHVRNHVLVEGGFLQLRRAMILGIIIAVGIATVAHIFLGSPPITLLVFIGSAYLSISRTSFRFFCTKSSWASNHDIVPIFS
jgi:hypothetical protein